VLSSHCQFSLQWISVYFLCSSRFAVSLLVVLSHCCERREEIFFGFLFFSFLLRTATQHVTSPAGKTYHKGCFKCSVCQTRVTLKSAKTKAEALYCEKCVPKDVATAVVDSVVMQNAKKGEQLKKEVGIQKSNVITGERGSQTADSITTTEVLPLDFRFLFGRFFTRMSTVRRKKLLN
jgi:hypothetical protein